MNRIYSLSARLSALALSLFIGLSFTACMDSHDETPNTPHHITADALPAPNATILSVKEKFRSAITGNNTFEQVKEDVVFDGVVVGNDVSGNLYQTLILRHIASTPGAADDQCLTLGIKSSQLYPYFALGQRIRINLKGLYIGNYSKTPKVGRPYYTSSGNLRLGPMFMEDVATNIALIGEANAQAPELTPLDFTTESRGSWLAQRSNKSYLNNPLLVSVRGTIAEVQGAAKNVATTGLLSNKTEPLPKIFAPRELYDAGFGVDRTLLLSNSSAGMTIRTSVRNAISYLPIPEGATQYKGVLTYFNDWQLQLRSTADIASVTQ